jgi:hypothetical protein
MRPRHKQDQGGDPAIGDGLRHHHRWYRPGEDLRYVPNSSRLASLAVRRRGQSNPAFVSFELHAEIDANADLRFPNSAVGRASYLIPQIHGSFTNRWPFGRDHHLWDALSLPNRCEADN